MKMSIWNLLTIILLVGTLGMVVIFGVIFILPNQVLPEGMRPVNVPPALVLPTSTETPFQFPPTWTKVPQLPTTTNTVVPSKTPTPTQTYTATATTDILVSSTPTLGPSSTGSRTATKTNTPISIYVTGASKTATKTKTLKPSVTPTYCPPGICGVLAVDDEAIVAPYPESIIVNVRANDLPDFLYLRITNLLDCPKKCLPDKHGTYITYGGGKVKIISHTQIQYYPAEGFLGTDNIGYKITSEGGSVDRANVIFTVTNGVEWPPTNISSVPSPLTFDENQSAGLPIGDLSATDVNGGPFTFTLVSGDGDANNNYFSLTGAGNLRSAGVYNCENKSTLEFRVRALDSIGYYYEKPLTVTVSDVNEFDPVITSGAAATGKESTVFTTFNITSSDADCTKTRTVSITGALPSGLVFAAVAGAGTATITGTPDIGSAGTYPVTLTVTDSGGKFTDKAFTITINP
jgi:hypothetical protein